MSAVEGKADMTPENNDRPVPPDANSYVLTDRPDLPYASSNDGNTSSRVLISSMGATSVSK
jgi:hypothetical protein